MKKYNVAILGSTGAVGAEIRKILLERSFPLGELTLLSGKKSEGKILRFDGRLIKCVYAGDFDFTGTDIVFGAVSREISLEYADRIVKAGCTYIDNSSAYRMDEDVPLVIPEINAEDVRHHKGIIANPNCSTIIALTAMSGIIKKAGIVSATVSTYQAVSGAGADGIAELKNQASSLVLGDKIECNVFPYIIAENLIPFIGTPCEESYTTEEMKMQNESRKILHRPDLCVTCTCVRVPVIRSHSISVLIETERPISPTEAAEAISLSPGCVLYDDVKSDIYPMPSVSSDNDSVYVGRVRRGLGHGNTVALFCCGDQLRKGAATNAVQIAEILVSYD